MLPVWCAKCLLLGTLLTEAVPTQPAHLAAAKTVSKELGLHLKRESRKVARAKVSAAKTLRKVAARRSRTRRLSESSSCNWEDGACSLDPAFASAVVEVMPDGDYKDFFQTCMVCWFAADSGECSGTEGCEWNTADDECECESEDDFDTLFESLYGDTSSCGSLALLLDGTDSEASECDDLDASTCAATAGCAVAETFEVVGEACNSTTICLQDTDYDENSEDTDDDGNALFELLCGEGFDFEEQCFLNMTDFDDMDSFYTCVSNSCPVLGTFLEASVSCPQLSEYECLTNSQCTSGSSCEADQTLIYDVLFADVSDSCILGQIFEQGLSCSAATTEASCSGDCSWQTSWSCWGVTVESSSSCDVSGEYIWTALLNSSALAQDEELFVGLMYTASECEAQTSESGCASVTSSILSTTTDAGTSEAEVVVVAGSLQLTSSSEDKALMCESDNLASGGSTWVVLFTALESSGVSMTGASLGALTCSDSAQLRGRRLQDGSFDLAFEATFSDVSSASSFHDEVSAQSVAVQSEFESQAASSLNVTVSATLGDLTVTSLSGDVGSTTTSSTIVATTDDITTTYDSFSNGALVRRALPVTSTLLAAATFFN